MRKTLHWGRLLFIGLATGLALVAIFSFATPSGYAATMAAANSPYVLLAWNDLGMHCYNLDFKDIAVLPPYNNLWAQVVKIGDPPQIITTGVSVSYAFPDNTYSVGKTNFWTYAQPLFGLKAPLAPNIGLTGKGLAGTLDVKADHFQADGIPLTEYSDSAPTVRNPFQLATVIATDTRTGREIARLTTVAPVSTEMHCDNCHNDNGRAARGIATGNVSTNILTLHDQDIGTNLMGSRPVLCASCHASNALGTKGNGEAPIFSNAMHEKHAGVVPNTIDGCYNCHPGPTTKCLRDVMSSKHGMDCISCHGTMSKVAQNPQPWLNEPRCDTCHNQSNSAGGNKYAQNDVLYRHSTGHAGIYCEACHDSTHAIAPSTQPNDGLKFIALQGAPGPLSKCTVCHATPPTGAGPHGVQGTGSAPPPNLNYRVYLPFTLR